MLAILNPKISGAFNIGSGEAYSNLEIAKIINECFNNEGNLLYNDKLKEGIESSLMDCSKSRNELGYIAQFSLRKALNEIKNFKKGEDV